MRHVQISKSSVQAMACEFHFAGSYLDPVEALRNLDSPAALTGQQFHQWRDEYISHLTWEGKEKDEAWAVEWLLAHDHFEDAAKDLIAWDLTKFTVKLGGREPMTEVFLSADAELNPLDNIPGAHYGEFRASKGSEYTVYIDLLQITGDKAVCTDYKTGFNTNGVHDYEGWHNACMVLLHFPEVEAVTWKWEFVRAGAFKEVEFRRSDLSRLSRMLLAAAKRRDEIAAKVTAGDTLHSNPLSGNCTYCELLCPLRQCVSAGDMAIGPLQDEADARRVSLMLKCADELAGRARASLREYLDSHGRIDVGDGYIADLAPGFDTVLPLDKALGVLDMALVPAELVRAAAAAAAPDSEAASSNAEMLRLVAALAGDPAENSPKWAVPLSKLAMSASKIRSYADTKKRAGLSNLLDEVSVKRPTSTLKIRKLAEGEV
jgi:hypothetical protein